ncbi:MAG: cofactor-independent phosphoglycerate mutase [Euryarchaeota archaeon]
MKYVVLIGDGMADYPLQELNNQTPLQVSYKPHMDEVAHQGINGLIKTIPQGMPPGSDVANLSIMGYNPQKYYTGRGPLEAASMGVDIGNKIAFRCNLITENKGILEDFNAGHISSLEAEILIKTLNKELNTGKFHAGISYRHLFLYDENISGSFKTTPPHDIVGSPIKDYLIPEDNPQAHTLNNLILDSKKVLENHPVNEERIKQGKKPANMIWLWGQGGKPHMESFKDKYGLKGSTITGVDLIKGLGVYLGLNNINVPGATGYFDTDYKAKGEYGVEALKDHDLLFIHVEAPDEAGHAGDITEKIKAIEQIDAKILGPLLDNLPSYEDFALALLPDHATPIPIKTHTMDPIPCAIYSSLNKGDGVSKYDEFSAKSGSLQLDYAYQLIHKLMSL